MKHKKLINFLSYLGLLPFYFLIILYTKFDAFYFKDIFFFYSLIIVSFLSGSSWINLSVTNNRLLIVVTILIPIVGLISEIFFRSELKIVLNCFLFYLLFFIDNRYLNYKIDYIYLRKNLTYLVIISQIIMLFIIYSNRIWDIFKTIFF